MLVPERVVPAAAARQARLPQAVVSNATKAVANKLTLIITTSPCRGGVGIHRALFRALFASFRQVNGLDGCRVIVVCDGYKLTKDKVKVKNGSISPEMASGYVDFLNWLDTELANSRIAGRSNWLSPYRM
jgi:hypothetical protein